MNFLQRAVAGVESRLDQVLASDPNTAIDNSLSSTAGSSNTVSNTSPTPTISSSTTTVPQASTVIKDAKPTPPVSASPTPPPGMGRMTMQERLAAAMARSGATRSSSPAVGSLSERAASPSPSPAVRRSVDDAENVRKSVDIPADDKITERTSSEEVSKVEPTAELVAVSTESKPLEDQEQPSTNGVESTPTDPPPLRTSTDTPRKSLESQPRVSIDAKPRASLDSRPRASIDKPRKSVEQPATAPTTTVSTPLTTTLTIEELESTISQLRDDLATCESRRAEEASAASERIDSLEEKLKYLAKESVEEARKRIQTGGSSALEKELAKRDERIALLLEEGERLSKIELKHMNNIKRLRAKAQEDEKAAAEAKRKQEKAEKEASDLKEKTRKAVEAEKRANEKLRTMNRLEVDNESLKRERDILQISTSDLKLQLAKAVARADDAESKVQTEALEAERKLTADLREKLEKAQNDATAEKERSKSEIWTLQSKLERDGDRAKAVELELKNEVSMLETKLEIMRARAEEASTGTSGHTHAKLLRQIETLQSQYAVASENWQGIEASLMTRLTNVEKERDELSRKEGDVRKKAREVNQKLKRLESDLESANLKIQDLESSLATQLTLCDDLRKQVTLHEDSKLQLTKKQDEERTAWQKEINNLRDSLKTASSAIVDDYASRPKSRPNSILEAEGAIRPLSPNPRPRKQSIGSDMNAPFPSKRMSRTESGDRLNEGPGSYRRPTLPEPTRQYTPSWGPTTPRFDSMSGYGGGGNISRQNSLFGGFGGPGAGMGISVGNYPSTPSFSTSMMSPGMPAQDGDNESIFEGNGGPMSPSSQEGRNGGAHLGEILSVSTVAAGPSVQLVERMSAAVRRLESEMASSREELVRMTAQRDEARAEVVAFMTEVDEKRSLETRLQALETDLKEKDGAYEATLVMLGEKSEEVEELRNDVADLKQMYRDLIMSQTNS
ncbi:hypothetical protein TWF569_000762 [Orbilia oligospora]|uniref:TATA element modulatory factor 1 TATA binding domain-containing protein n=1 Tax=Orbilia oligospora TaxID=2813651 RepID=A0A7C8NKW6_ORBOL|nr:hypothetical protein TWF102_005535 [Orbilia oligospora]KAF3103608.1 hypothetical protein TWF103_007124 [Orbilia oligospora]KAF3125654.1 hypothetical protein TWF569_000762 [Orbilia oligospora]KAF3128341.1 hypothetical protein TWF703_009577 [Orbilia oligospora]